jgi:C4-dicarboxylate-specific signal transduction histidine kinase
MLLENGEGSSNEVREILTDIKSENRRATGIVRQVRSMLGDVHTSGGPIAVGELLGDVSRSAAPEAARRSVDLVLPDSGSAEGFLLGDRVLLTQVFLNLIFNAMDAVAEVPLSRRIVTLGYEILPEERMIEFSVTDRGSGIEPSERESIFEFFHTTKEEGLGIGLAISRAIVTDHSGSLSVENPDEGGARFRVKLPLHEKLP